MIITFYYQTGSTHWFDSWQQKGGAGLRNQSGLDKDITKSKVQSSPQELKNVRQELKEKSNKDFSQKTLKRFFKRLVEPLGKSWKKSEIQTGHI